MTVRALPVSFLAAALSLVCLPASAVNKCTGPDGKISYQESPCGSSSKSTTVEIQPGPAELAKQWKFSRQRDDMTGREVCFATSPEVLMNVSRGMYSYATVFVQFSVLPNFGGMAMTVRSRQGEASGLFHTNIDGLGVKVDGGPFVPLTEKVSSNVLSFGEKLPKDLISAMQESQSIRLRLRFWPYDQLQDSQPIGLMGFKKAMLAAMGCASK